MTALPFWPDVLATALVGTDRREAGDPTQLLDTAAALTAYRRAGVRPVSGLSPPEAAPEETAPLVRPAAAARLVRLADQGPAADGLDAELRTELLAEWLTIAASRALRVPGELLPALLDAGRRRRDLRPMLVAAGGARAGWLAAQRPEWAYLLGERDDHTAADPAAWELGAVGRRVGYLTAARQRDPDAARELLAATWADESPDDRAALLGALGTALSTSDEPFLEAALDDRRREVRAEALALLGRLPDSAHRARMAARARACVRRDGRNRLAITPPAECDRQLRRDGVTPKPPAGVGERAWWLEEILARTPLETWTGEGGPAGFLALRAADEWRAVLVRGLARAATTAGDPTWAGPLVDALARLDRAQGRPDDLLLGQSLFAALAPDEIVARTVTVLRRDPTVAGGDHLLELSPHPWPPQLADAVFDTIEVLVNRSTRTWRVNDIARLAAARLPVDAAPKATELVESLRRKGVDVPRTVEWLADILRFRHDMLEELT